MENELPWSKADFGYRGREVEVPTRVINYFALTILMPPETEKTVGKNSGF